MKCIKYIVLVLILIITALAVIINLIPDSGKNELKVVFIDTGNSDSIFIKTPDGKNVLIDGGLEKSLRNIHDVLYKYDVSTIDYMINTHQHDDHLGSFPDLIKIYDVKNFYMPKSNIENEHYDMTMKVLKNNNIPVNIMKRGDIICDGEVKIEVLSPYSDIEFFNENNFSAVLLLTYKERKFLFTGDAEKYVLNTLVIDYGLSDCDVLKVSHHGSKDATNYFFLENIAPEYAVVTSDAKESNNKEYIENLLENFDTKYYFTGESGNITFICDGQNIETETERKTENENR